MGLSLGMDLRTENRTCHHNGRTEPFFELCKLFNSETNQGQNMDKYSSLLQQGIEEISLGASISNSNFHLLADNLPALAKLSMSKESAI